MLDAHCHLDRYPDPLAVAAEARARGVFVVAVTNLPSHFVAGHTPTRGLQGVRLALGLHPLAVGANEHEIARFRPLLAQTSFVGEVGLDFSRDGIGTRELQLRAFREVVGAIRDAGAKFITLHSRRAETAVLEVLREFQVGPAVFHWFSGTRASLDRVLEAGHYVSVNPAMTGSQKGAALIARMPHDRVLSETDGPYVQLSSKPCNPWDVSIVQQHLAKVWAVTETEVRDRVWANFRQLTRVAHGAAGTSEADRGPASCTRLVPSPRPTTGM